MSLNQMQKAVVVPPRNAMALDSLRGVRAEMARLYRLALNGRIPSDEMTRYIYALKEIRACLEAEILTDVQQRLVVLSRNMDNPKPHPSSTDCPKQLTGSRARGSRAHGRL
jgi:hypothetical protein